MNDIALRGLWETVPCPGSGLGLARFWPCSRGRVDSQICFIVSVLWDIPECFFHYCSGRVCCLWCAESFEIGPGPLLTYWTWVPLSVALCQNVCFLFKVLLCHVWLDLTRRTPPHTRTHLCFYAAHNITCGVIMTRMVCFWCVYVCVCVCEVLVCLFKCKVTSKPTSLHMCMSLHTVCALCGMCVCV